MNKDMADEIRIVDLETRPKFRLWLRYSDGVEGEVDLSEMAKLPAFRGWHEDVSFNAVGLMPGNILVWNDAIDLCGDSLYLKLTGKEAADLFPMLRELECPPLPASAA